jgi:hypothetical protein
LNNDQHDVHKDGVDDFWVEDTRRDEFHHGVQVAETSSSLFLKPLLQIVGHLMTKHPHEVAHQDMSGRLGLQQRQMNAMQLVTTKPFLHGLPHQHASQGGFLQEGKGRVFVFFPRRQMCIEKLTKGDTESVGRFLRNKECQ